MDTPRGTNGLHKPRKPLRRRIRRTLKRIRRPEAITLEEGLDKLAELLGLHDTRIDDPEERAAVTTVRPTEHHARSIYYAPDMDGQADPGEVIWVWIQPNLPGHPARERAMVVVGRSQHLLLGLLISPNPEHANEDNWIDIGSGGWDVAGRQCWARLDKILEVPESTIRRQGAIIPKSRFERIAQRLRSDYSWV